MRNHEPAVPSSRAQKPVRAPGPRPAASPLCASFALENVLDSCILQRRKKATSEGSAPTPSSIRHRASRLICRDSPIMATRLESSMPQPCIEITKASIRPRVCGCSEDSAVTVAESGYSPPTPTPRTSLQSASCRGSGIAPPSLTRALRTAPTTVRPAVATKAHFRPSQSATKPKESCPTMMPASIVLTIRLLLCASETSAPYSKPRINITRSIVKRSYASARKPALEAASRHAAFASVSAPPGGFTSASESSGRASLPSAPRASCWPCWGPVARKVGTAWYMEGMP
mmetsp:Transcript_1864/g.5639  ORF Transcript_1864/g.5639 Transcript_1864/m.5639 type:complete len:287 (+) Transcript_1864:637-1497(+)